MRAHPLLVDALIVLGLVIVALMSGAADPVPDSGVAMLANLALVSTLLLRRVAPVLSFGALSLLLAVQALLTSEFLPGDAAFPFGVYAIAAYGPRWARWAGLATGLAGAVIAARLWWSGSIVGTSWWELYGQQLALLCAVVLSAWTLGSLRRTRQGYIAEIGR